MTNRWDAAKSKSSVKFLAVLSLTIAFGWVFIPGVSTRQITDVHNDMVNMCAKWLVVLLLCVITFGVQHWKPSQLGIRKLGWRDVLAGIGGAVLAVVLGGAVSQIARATSLPNLRALAAVPLGIRIAVVLTAAICEEFMYRGIGIEELALLVGNRWLAGLLSLIVFAFSHVGLYGLSTGLLIPAAVGAVLTGLYLLRRNLWSCVLVHAIVDSLYIILVPAVMHAR